MAVRPSTLQGRPRAGSVSLDPGTCSSLCTNTCTFGTWTQAAAVEGGHVTNSQSPQQGREAWSSSSEGRCLCTFPSESTRSPPR